MLVRVGHAINLGTKIAEHLGLFLLRLIRLRNINPLLNRNTLINLFDPLLEGRIFRKINLQGDRRRANP